MGSIDAGRREFLRHTLCASAAVPLLGSCALGAPAATPAGDPAGAPVASSIASRVTVALGRRLDRGPLDSSYVGLSYEKAKLATPFFSSDNRLLVGLCRGLGSSLLRLGGNSVDQTNWDPRGPGGIIGVISPADLERLAAFLAAANWQVLYGVNLGSNSPARAASEAREAAAVLGDRLAGFEIGNEPDLFHYNGLRSPQYSFADFLAEWRTYRDAIEAAVPHAQIAGPSSSSDAVGYCLPLARAEGRRLAVLSHHYYRGNGEDPSSTIARMLSPDPYLEPTLELLDRACRDNQVALGFRYTEANSFYHGGARKVSDTFASALWVIDFLFATASAGSLGVNLHGGGTTSVYTPIADDNRVVFGPRAEYYGLYLFALAARGQLLETVTDSGGLNFSAHAVEDRQGAFRVVLNNKETARAARVEVAFGGAVRAVALTPLTAPRLESTGGILLAGSTLSEDGSWHPEPQPAVTAGPERSFEFLVPAASALLVHAQT